MTLEIRPDGLHLSGSLLTRETARSTVSKLLGQPTRTNQVADANKIIYAYDAHGILVYSQPGFGDEAIVLDFEGVGGTNGTRSPFPGALQVDDRLIRADTDSHTLASIKQLGLKEPGTDGGIFGGQCNGLELIFAYLKTTQRLSLIEINLK